MLKEIQNIEIAMDKVNTEYGDRDCLCIYCKSKTYSGSVGVHHETWCPIIYARGLILKLINDGEKDAHKRTN